MLLHKLVFLFFFYYSYFSVCTRLFPMIHICIRCEKHLLSFTSFISSTMRTPLFLSSKPLYTKVLLFNFFIPVIFNVQHIYCLELSTSSVGKGIPHQPDWLIQTISPNALPSISETCLDHTEQYLKALRNRQSWAVKSKF